MRSFLWLRPVLVGGAADACSKRCSPSVLGLFAGLVDRL